ncbi:hypothetical protein [Halobacterium yunchengense]|uniref:hypothetical protein n=1 Tax=Halobacterium yunchengense TaxID=3108497 RepID=UPI003007F841
MDCTVCSQTGAAYRLVGAEPLAVCEQCVAAYLAGAVDSGTCVYCSRAGDLDLAEDTGALAGSASPDEYEVVSEGVVCADHVSRLRGEDA